jgi:hypothetical protein
MDEPGQPFSICRPAVDRVKTAWSRDHYWLDQVESMDMVHGRSYADSVTQGQHPARGFLLEAEESERARLLPRFGELTEHLAKPETFTLQPLSFRAWGRKPA